MVPTKENMTLTRIPGIRVGHTTDALGVTGVTVVLCEAGAVAGVDQRGGAPGTRETDLLRPMHLVRQVHAVVLAGGSAFGLAAADGVVRYLSERGIGFATAQRHVPIVPAAVLFDLDRGDPGAFPGPDAGYAACGSASSEPVQGGGVGAGAGCSVGKLLGPAQATPAGIGNACTELGRGVFVAALMAVNAVGDIVDEGGAIIAGARRPDGRWANSLSLLGSHAGTPPDGPPGATVIGVVATNARLDKEQANHVALMAQDGVARAVRPAHTIWDGDTLFTLSSGQVEADASTVGAYAAEVVAAACRESVRSSRDASP